MFDFTYNLENHGWATASASNGDQSVGMTVSYLSNGLGDFACAVRGLIRGMSEATFSLFDEPGEHRVIFKRDGEKVHATVYWFDDEGANLPRGKVALTAECSVAELATMTINCLRAILDTHGESGYRERWQRHDFPTQEYRDLLELRRKHAATAPWPAPAKSTEGGT